MFMRRFTIAAALVAATSLVAGVALADGRPPTADETSAISAALTKAGFSKWGKVEFDDGKWEIDNAVGADGKFYDVVLSPKDLSVIKKELDND
jgi:outer membrane lipoprotein-sorting protein